MARFLGGLILFLSCTAYGACDYKSIQSTDSGYLLSEECYQEFGAAVKERKLLREKVGLLEQRVTAYEQLLALSREETELQRTRAEMWQNTSKDLNLSLTALNTTTRWENYLYFAAGALMVFGASK